MKPKAFIYGIYWFLVTYLAFYNFIISVIFTMNRILLIEINFQTILVTEERFKHYMKDFRAQSFSQTLQFTHELNSYEANFCFDFCFQLIIKSIL